MDPASTVQPTADRNIWEKIIPESSKKQNEFAVPWQLFTKNLHCIHNYLLLHSIYIVLGIISYLEMVECV